MASSHVPAWKRIGLRLKTPAEENSESAPKKRRLDVDSNDTIENSTTGKAKSAPKQKFALKTADLRAIAAGTQKPEAISNGPVEATNEQAKRPGEGLETKLVDNVATPSVDTGAASSAPPTLHQSKAEKRQASLDYLDLYYRDREKWKFNKQQQTRLFKDCFNLYRIPASYDAALLAYITGLQSAAVRTRLKETAQKILDEEASTRSASDALDKPTDALMPSISEQSEKHHLGGVGTSQSSSLEGSRDASKPQNILKAQRRNRANLIVKALAEFTERDHGSESKTEVQPTNSGDEPAVKIDQRSARDAWVEPQESSQQIEPAAGDDKSKMRSKRGGRRRKRRTAVIENDESDRSSRKSSPEAMKS